MLVVRATQKLLKRVKGPMAPDWAETTGVLGEWYATALFWKPQVALLVNTRTLVPVFAPLAPANKLWMRIPYDIEMVLMAHGVDYSTVRDYCGDLGPVGFAPTDDRRVVGVMNEYTRLAEHFYEGDLTTLSVRLARTPISSLKEGGGFPDQALAEIFGHTPAEPPDISPQLRPASTPTHDADPASNPESVSSPEPEHLAKIIPFPGHRRTAP